MSELFETVNSKRTQRVNIRLSKEEKQWIDETSAANESNASDVIRDALRVYKTVLEGEKDV